MGLVGKVWLALCRRSMQWFRAVVLRGIFEETRRKQFCEVVVKMLCEMMGTPPVCTTTINPSVYDNNCGRYGRGVGSAAPLYRVAIEWGVIFLGTTLNVRRVRLSVVLGGPAKIKGRTGAWHERLMFSFQ